MVTDSEELARLGELHARGVLNNDEFAQAKARVLSGRARLDEPAMNSLQRLRRSRHDRWLGGVCGGLGELTGAPSWIWRLMFTFLVICAGTGLLAYILLWVFLPSEP